MPTFHEFAADHRSVLEDVARAARIDDPVAIDLDQFYLPLVNKAVRREILPIDGVLIRDWDPSRRKVFPGIRLGCRVYEIEGIRFANVLGSYLGQNTFTGFQYFVVARANYLKLYKLALKTRREATTASPPPIMHPDQQELLWRNTIGYLDEANLKKIKEYGGRPKRGVLLMGPPGNGKTSACRWIWEECQRRGWEWHLVTPDAYREARAHDAVKDLFSVNKRGIVFFDDMDLALRDRDSVHETEDQAVFLSAIDGIEINEGVVFVFTTNCSLDLIDRAFKRPGRLDLVLHFEAPAQELRRNLFMRWHVDIRTNLDLDECVMATDGFSFAEIEELKNLLIMHFMDQQNWDWEWAMRQLSINRNELGSPKRRRHVGFGASEPHRDELVLNGK